MESKKDKTETVIGRLVKSLNEPDGEALGLLTPEIYDRLRQLSRRFMRRERAGHTMQPTEVVNEALVRLQRKQPGAFNDTQHFYATAAKQMRWVLVEYARHRRMKLIKDPSPPEDQQSASPADSRYETVLLELNDCLSMLEKQDPELARACELHYFGGHTLPETAALMGVSEATVIRRLRLARAWFALKMDRSAKLSNDDSD